MSRVLITGIDGFTGRYVAQALVDRGHEVVGMARDRSIPHDAQVTATYEADLDDPAALSAMMAQVRPDRIVHLAAISAVTHGDVAAIYQTNVVGTRNLLQASVSAGIQPDAILLASSANIYGNASQGQIDETAPLVPVNDYGVSKLAMEHIGRIYSNRLPIIIVRPFNYTGAIPGLHYSQADRSCAPWRNANRIGQSGCRQRFFGCTHCCCLLRAVAGSARRHWQDV